MSDDLYQAAILEHAKARTHAGRLSDPKTSVTIDNPLCGDRVTLDVKLADGRITEISHHVRGCALCQAAASVLAAGVVGRAVADAREGRDRVKALFAGDEPAGPWQTLSIFKPVRAHKSRQDCVRLPFDALDQALDQATKT